MNEHNILEQLIEEFYDKLKSLHNLVPRTAAFPNIKDKINVAIGMRRSGKTYFVFQKIKQLLESGVKLTEILYINFEDDRLLPLDASGLAGLLDGFYSMYPENHEKPCYFFLDEIQNVENWPTVIRRFFDSKNISLFLTGSSAKLLSKEIATSLRGRSLATEVWPYDFNEYQVATHRVIDTTLFGAKVRDTLMQVFCQYIDTGGFPEVIHYEPNIRDQVLQDYVTIVTFRDIIERHNISNTAVIKYMISTMLANVATLFSINKFYNDLKSQGYKVSKDSLYDYADYIEDAYLLFSVPLYAASIRKVQANPKKIYAIDTGLVRAMVFDMSKDKGHLFENLIYLDLRRRGLDIYYYLTSDRYEVDFLVQTRKGEKELIQVTWDMSNDTTKQREERALKAAMLELGIPGQIITVESYLRHGITLSMT
ncbi:MAG: ATP-binding protein [Gammaproteobacteria bacterium]|nr:ATP-binding protein [Gammaproteobacteria bacterium]